MNPQNIQNDLAAYRASKGGSSAAPASSIDADLQAYRASKTQQPQDTSGVTSPYQQGDSVGTVALKALQNTPQSLANFAKGTIKSVNPLNTLGTVADIGSGIGDYKKESGKTTGGAILDIIKGLPKAAYETLVPKGIQQAFKGDLEGATKTFTEDPFGQAAPIVLAATGAAKLSDAKLGTKIEPAVDNAISKTAKAVTKPIGAIVKAPVDLVKGATRSAVSQLTGLDPESISRIIADPEQYSKLQREQTSRGNLASEFGKAVDSVEEGLADTGKEYAPIRENKTAVPVPPRFVDNVFKQFGLDIKNGKVTGNSNSLTRNAGDLRALQHFYDNWGNKKALTANEYLNFRKDIAGIAKFGKEIGTNADAQIVGTKLYSEANAKIRPNIKGLEELDAKYAPQKQQFAQIKKDFLQKDANGEYVFKDGAVNKIANAANKGKDALLARMEEVMPGVTKQIQILRTVEDIEKAYGNKVGTYGRSIVAGGALLGGSVPAVIAAIITNPAVAVPLLRSLGYTAQTVAPIIATLKTIAGDVNHLTVGGKSVKTDGPETKNNALANGQDAKLISEPAQAEPTGNSNQGMSNHAPSITSDSMIDVKARQAAGKFYEDQQLQHIQTPPTSPSYTPIGKKLTATPKSLREVRESRGADKLSEIKRLRKVKKPNTRAFYNAVQ